MVTTVGQARPCTALITGATDGLGLALARVLAARGDRLILLGRRPLATLDDPLFNVATYCEVDLAMPDCADVLDRFLRERGITAVDLAIQNAGVGWYGPLAEQPPERIEELLRVNLLAPLALTHTLLPALWRARGTLVFIGSVAAALPVPQYAVYGATKAALEGFGRSLRIELAGQVAVHVLHPGAIRTALHAKSGMMLAPAVARRYLPPERVAAQIIAALERGPATTALGATNRALRFASRHAAPVVDALVRGRQRRAGQAIGTGIPPTPADKHCVITGAADGIGRSLAHAFGAAGYRVTGIDRDEALSARTHAALTERGIPATFLRADLTDRADVARIVAHLAQDAPIDCLIHCAGISAVGRFARADLAAQARVLDLNLGAPLILTAGLLAQGALAPGGTLVFIASLSCFTGYPGAAAYAASKDGVAAFARSLRVGLATSGQHVLIVYPGPTRTAHARRYSPDNRREARRMPPEVLAARILAAVRAGQGTLIPGPGNRLFALIGMVAPGLAELVMRKTIFERLDRTARRR